jgi:hypothetical protein
MPLIRVMYDARLSWAERETIAAAVNACVIEWHRLMSEHERHVQSAMGAKMPNDRTERPAHSGAQQPETL